MLEEHNEVLKIQMKTKEMQHQFFIENTLWTWEWWLLLFLTIFSWILFWIFTDKKRLKETLIFGLFVIVLTLLLDTIGTGLFWWSYPINLFETIPSLTPVDVCIIPCMMMVIYSKVHSWKEHLLYFSIFSILATYVGENLFEWLNYYNPITWKHLHSVLWHMLLAIAGKFLIDKVTKIEKEQSK